MQAISSLYFPVGRVRVASVLPWYVCRRLATAVLRAGARADPGCLSVVLQPEWARGPHLSARGQMSESVLRRSQAGPRPDCTDVLIVKNWWA